jgi:hypothetical protein
MLVLYVHFSSASSGEWAKQLLELDGSAVSALWRAIAEVKQHWSVIGWLTKTYYLELFRASEGALSRWTRLHLQSLAPTNPLWARVMGYGPFSLCVIHKEGLWPSSGDINRLTMMMTGIIWWKFNKTLHAHEYVLALQTCTLSFDVNS